MPQQTSIKHFQRLISLVHFRKSVAKCEVSGHSTVTNILSCDILIVNMKSRIVVYDIIAFDFRKAIDKVPHSKLLEDLSTFNLSINTLAWIGNSLSDSF